MGTFRFAKLGVLIFIFQVFSPGLSEEPECRPGFQTDVLIFKVERMHLHKGRVLGKVGFDDCSGRNRFLFATEDKRFRVESDGSLKLKREVTLHSGQKDFSVHAWDSQGRKITVTARVVLRDGDHSHQCYHGHSGSKNQDHEHSGAMNQNHDGHKNHNHHGHKNHNHSHSVQPDQDHKELQELVAPEAHQHLQAPESGDMPVLFFPKASSGLIRKKRAWIIPPINFPENDKGPFPKKLVRIRSDSDRELVVEYKISGPGADLPPEKLFTVDKMSGQMYVTKPLDRERQDRYTLKAYATTGNHKAEDPMEIIIYVIDMNDNKPVFAIDPFLGRVPEASSLGYEFMQVKATDADEPGNSNSDIGYSIVSQEPTLPGMMFAINPASGVIRVNRDGLDREKYPKYTLEVQAADMGGEGLTGRSKVIITVTDTNNNAPQFISYTVSAPENKAGFEMLKMQVTDGDDPHTEAWNAVFNIVGGDPEGRFTVTTGPSKQEGILSTAKELDFERVSRYTLTIAVVNEVPFTKRMPTSTTTVVVTVEDVNEAPVFNPAQKLVVKREDLKVGDELAVYTATDPDTQRKQTVTYRMQNDPAGWLSMNKDNGRITVKSEMDRESHFVIDGKYTALIAASDNDNIPATGTGTLLIQLEDVN